ncbi:unnamed protein product [Effrenium voratum]|nr:unnamed protein product [Effrenium voratum]
MHLRQIAALLWNATRCTAHLLCQVVDMLTPKCNCGRAKPCFGRLGDERPSCCARCKMPDMVNIMNPKCSVCGKSAHYSDAFGRPRRLCAVHSAEVGAHVLSSPRY